MTNCGRISTAWIFPVPWRITSRSIAAGNASISDFLANPDSDGLANALEYFHDTVPQAGTAHPLQIQIVSDRVVLTFSRNSTATDIIANLSGADTPKGPWIDLARSIGGAPFAPLIEGVTVGETGAGTLRSVEITDLYSVPDSSHPYGSSGLASKRSEKRQWRDQLSEMV